MTHNTNIPTGEDYLVKIVAITKKESQSFRGGIATILTYEVVEGKYRGEQIADYLSFQHESLYARNIAQAKKSNIYNAVGMTPKSYACGISEGVVGKTMVIHMDMEQGLNTVSRSGYRPPRDYRGFHTYHNAAEKPHEEELVIEFTAPAQCEYMIIRRHGCSRRVNFSSEDNQEKRMMKMTETIRELDYASGKTNGGK